MQRSREGWRWLCCKRPGIGLEHPRYSTQECVCFIRTSLGLPLPALCDTGPWHPSKVFCHSGLVGLHWLRAEVCGKLLGNWNLPLQGRLCRWSWRAAGGNSCPSEEAGLSSRMFATYTVPEGPALGYPLCWRCSVILSFWTRGPEFAFCIKPKLHSQSCEERKDALEGSQCTLLVQKRSQPLWPRLLSGVGQPRLRIGGKKHHES